MVNRTISDRLAGLKEEIAELGLKNRRYLESTRHTELEKSAHVQRKTQLVGIMAELSEMKRSA
jgi:hypothetical protein